MMKTRAIPFGLIAMMSVFLWTISAMAYNNQAPGPVEMDERQVQPGAVIQDDDSPAPPASPVIDLNGAEPGTDHETVHAAGGDPSNIASPNMTIVDPDDTELQGATVRITNLKHKGKEILDVGAVEGISQTYDLQEGVLTLTGAASLADYRDALSFVTYRVLTGVTNLNTEERNIQVVVSDGESDSAPAISRVSIIAPRISIEATTPASDTPIPVGAYAIFHVTITNNANSNVDLKDIAVTVVPSSLAEPPSPVPTDNCGRNLADVLAPGAGTSFDCWAGPVQLGSYSYAFSVAAKDAILGTVVSAKTDTPVRVTSPIVIGIANKTGAMPLKGQNATFTITVTNPSEQDLKNVGAKAVIRYYDVGIGDYSEAVELPICSRNELAAVIEGGGYKAYDCTIPNVQSSFRLEVKATGYFQNVYPVADVARAEVSVIDLSLEVSADPPTINTGTLTPVTFNVVIHNHGRSAMTLTSLVSDPHGDLLAAGLDENTCVGIDKTLTENATRTCSYKVILIDDPPEPFAFVNSVTAVASYGNNKSLSVVREVIVTAEGASPLDVVLSADPLRLIAPGGILNLTVKVKNNTTFDLTINKLEDSELGDLDHVGDCETSRRLLAGATYSCTYPAVFGGVKFGDEVSRSVTVTAAAAQASGAVTIPVMAGLYLPMTSMLSQFGEPNGSACTATPIAVDFPYFGLPDDTWDFYRVTTTAPLRLIASIRNFQVTDGGQLLAYKGRCENPEFITSNGVNGLVPDREIDLGLQEPGTFFIAVYVASEQYFNDRDSYELSVQATAP